MKKIGQTYRRFIRVSAWIIVLGTSVFLIANTTNYRTIPNKSFGTGERILYKVRYGFVNAGDASVTVDEKVTRINNRPCYFVTVDGRTTGISDVLYKIRDVWQSHIDTAAIVSQQFQINLREGGYRKKARVVFDHVQDKATSIESDDSSRVQKVPNNIQDLISSYYFLRTLEFSKMTSGENILIKSFFDNEIIDLRMRFRGKDVVETAFGKINVFKVAPIVPANKFFDGNEPISIWISDDSNRLPIKIEVSLKIGTLHIDMKDYTGLRNDLKFY